MLRQVAYVVVVSLLVAGAAPAYAVVLDRTPVSAAEEGALAAQEVVDAPQVAEVAAGEGNAGLIVLAAVGATLLVLLIIGAAAG